MHSPFTRGAKAADDGCMTATRPARIHPERCGLIAALSLILISATISGAATTKTSSVFVKIDDPNCIKVDGVEDEDWATLRCGKTVAGWRVYVEYADARESVALERKGVRTDLNFYQFNPGFSTLGPVLEFRVRSGTPIAAVVRHIHSVNPDDATITESVLMVAKLSPKPCVIAAIPPGPQQSAQARVAADKAPTTRCLPGN
jgi:hypothetical protein